MMVNAFGPLSDQIFIFNPFFFTKPPRDPRSYEDESWFELRLSEILAVREVTEEFWKYRYHICVINDSSHWFAIVADLSGRKKNGKPNQISLYSLDSLESKYRRTRTNMRMNQICSFYTSLIRSCNAKTKIIRSPPGTRFYVSRIQRNSFDGGAFTVWNTFLFLSFFHGPSSIIFPSKQEDVGAFVRNLISDNKYHELTICKKSDGIIKLFGLRDVQSEIAVIDHILDFELFLQLLYKFTDLQDPNKS